MSGSRSRDIDDVFDGVRDTPGWTKDDGYSLPPVDVRVDR